VTVAVDESWTSVFDGDMDVTYYVDQDHGSASDSNDGLTPEAPLLTIQEGVDRAATNRGSGLSTKIIVSASVYREKVEKVVVAGTAPIILEGAGSGLSVISGSDHYASGVWTEDPPASGQYSTSWTNNWGLLDVPGGWPATPDIARRREVVFEDGVRLEPVLTIGELAAGKFFVDEAADKLYVEPNVDLDFIEVGIRNRAAYLQLMDYIKVSGFSIRHAASSDIQGGGFTIFDSDYVVVTDVIAHDSSHTAWSLFNNDNMVVRNCRCHGGGLLGLGTGRSADAIFDDIELDDNNWRGNLGGFTVWSTGGCKHLRAHRCEIKNYSCHDNFARGFWADTDFVDVLIENLDSRDNLEDGVMLEILQGPVTLVNVLSIDNTNNGLVTRNVRFLTLKDVQVFDNTAGQFILSGIRLGSSVTDYETTDEITVLPSDDWIFDGIELRGTVPIDEEGENPGQGPGGDWANLTNLEVKWIHFFTT
jgi:hypothetical protein